MTSARSGSSDRIRELRRRLPVPMSWCRDALAACDGDLDAAQQHLVRRSIDALIERTGMDRDAAHDALDAVGYDLERAVAVWRQAHPPPPPTARERLAGGHEIAGWIDLHDPDLVRVVHVLPHGGGRFELRRITHRAIFTECSFGLDYDVALEDPSTRVLQLTVEGVDAVLDQLRAWGALPERWQPPEAVDSCLVNAPIDAYLDAGRLEHLHLPDRGTRRLSDSEHLDKIDARRSLDHSRPDRDPSMTTLLVLAGSNSSRSINRRLARWAASQLDDVRRADVDLNDYEMPIYSPDREEADGLPDRARAFVGNIASVDGIVLSLAEHNGSYSAAFKNVLDWASRVDGKLFAGKPMLLLATSPGGRGAQTVLEAAAGRFPFHAAKIAATFSLPSFTENFSDTDGITDPELRSVFDDALAAFRKALDEG